MTEAAFNILVIDDDPAMRDCCSQILSRSGCHVQVAEDGAVGLEYLAAGRYDVLLLDLKMPGMPGLEVLERARRTAPDTAVIIITGFATVDSAVRSMKAGALDYLPKPFTPNMLRQIVSRVLEERRDERDGKPDESSTGDQTAGTDAGNGHVLIGKSPEMQRLRRMIRKIAASGSTVLITGESGTGKELVARALHRYSPRANEPFVVVDCGCLVEDLAEAELFGHVAGAFTGAVAERVGRFQMAHRGTIFLDEISNIGLSVQQKLLRVLQELEVTPVGSSEVMSVDVRTVAATNTDLTQRIRAGHFREDLYYRLNVIPVYLPPLRDRREDIPLLADHFFRRYNTRYRGGSLRAISDRAVRLLEGYDWPGNVRQLENVVERAVVLTENDVVDEEDIIGHGCLDPHSMRASGESLLLSQAEKEHIQKVLLRYNNNILRSANALGIDRKTLRHKARKYGLLGGGPPG